MIGNCMPSRILLVLLLALQAEFALAQGSVQRGAAFVRANCARCHAVERAGPSPLAIAPPLRELHRRYPMDDLAEAFAEGITTGHPSMPEYRLAPDQIEDVLAYMRSLASARP
jgi:mono/diheme cytochrome c family protein